MPACKACGLMLPKLGEPGTSMLVCEDCGQDQRDPVHIYTGWDLGPEDPPEDPEMFDDDPDEYDKTRYGKFGPRD